MRDATDNVEYMPTQEQIAERAARVRLRWGPKMEKSRRVIPPTDPVTVTGSTQGRIRHNGIESIW